MANTYLFPHNAELSKEDFISKTSDMYWYHSFYFGNGWSVKGEYDTGRTIGSYGFPRNLRDKVVVDVGAASGWFSFFFERQGALVTSVDLMRNDEWNVYGKAKNVNDAIPVVRDSFNVMSDILESNVTFLHSTAYDLSHNYQGESPDLIFMGTMLCHLRDPIGALIQARRIISDDGLLIAATPVLENATRQPAMYLRHPNTTYWFDPDERCYRHWFKAAGFSQVDITREVMLYKDSNHPLIDEKEDHIVMRVAHARV